MSSGKNITWTNIDTDLYHYMGPLGHNVLNCLTFEIIQGSIHWALPEENVKKRHRWKVNIGWDNSFKPSNRKSLLPLFEAMLTKIADTVWRL